MRGAGGERPAVTEHDRLAGFPGPALIGRLISELGTRAAGYCAPDMARSALAFITAIVSASWSLGLNWTNSVPATAAGICPGVM